MKHEMHSHMLVPATHQNFHCELYTWSWTLGGDKCL